MMIRTLLACSILASILSLTGCSTDTVADARMSGVERRQSRMDARTEARQERWRVRAEREDARADAFFEQM